MLKRLTTSRGGNQGFTIPEILITVLILLPIFIGTMYVFIQCMGFRAMARNSSYAVLACKDKMAEIENTGFAGIAGTFDNTTFTSADVTDGKGVVYVDDSQPNVVGVTVSFSWKERNGRLFGEDADLDGQIDNGEDINGNNMLDSPVEFTTVIYDR